MTSPNPVTAPAHIHALLNRLHNLSSAQEQKIDKSIYSQINTTSFDDLMRTQFVALDQDKCQFVYQICRSIAAKNVVEAGTSFGVSTIYLALAVGQNCAGERGMKGRVVATEKEAEKIAVARRYWAEAGEVVEAVIELREGDLLKTLERDLPVVDLLLLDIWAPLALPTLKVVLPKLRPGAVVITDNTISAKDRYADLLEYLRAPGSGFSNITVPFQNGLELSVYHPLH